MKLSVSPPIGLVGVRASNLAELYRRKVERLTEALNDRDDRTEATTALRGLIDKIVLTPGAERGEISARLFGDLETVLTWTHDREEQRREAVGRFPWEFDGALSVRAGARTCFGDP